MTRSCSQATAIALGAAAFLSLSPLSVAFADSPAASAPTSTAPARVATPTPTSTTTAAANPSLSEPSPTPGWAEAGPNSGSVGQHSGTRHPAHHYAYRNGNRYETNPIRTAANGVAGSVADLGSIAAYPFYCFPNYGSCSVKVPYRF